MRNRTFNQHLHRKALFKVKEVLIEMFSSNSSPFAKDLIKLGHKNLYSIHAMCFLQFNYVLSSIYSSLVRLMCLIEFTPVRFHGCPLSLFIIIDFIQEQQFDWKCNKLYNVIKLTNWDICFHDRHSWMLVMIYLYIRLYINWLRSRFVW